MCEDNINDGGSGLLAYEKRLGDSKITERKVKVSSRAVQRNKAQDMKHTK